MKFLKLTTIVLMSMFFAACDSFKSDTNGVKYNAKKEYKEFKAYMSEKLNDIDSKIQKLEASSKNKASQVNRQAINRIESIRGDLKETLEETHDTTKDAYADFKTEIDKKYRDLENEVNKAFN